jgi:hypothetical protein
MLMRLSESMGDLLELFVGEGDRSLANAFICPWWIAVRVPMHYVPLEQKQIK